MLSLLGDAGCGDESLPLRLLRTSEPKLYLLKNAVHRYLSRVSGPLLDRLDLHVEVPAVNYDELSSSSVGESSAQIKLRVNRARQVQRERYRGRAIRCNARLTPAAQRSLHTG